MFFLLFGFECFRREEKTRAADNGEQHTSAAPSLGRRVQLNQQV